MVRSQAPRSATAPPNSSIPGTDSTAAARGGELGRGWYPHPAPSLKKVWPLVVLRDANKGNTSIK